MVVTAHHVLQPLVTEAAGIVYSGKIALALCKTERRRKSTAANGSWNLSFDCGERCVEPGIIEMLHNAA
jgi:hypothetical protein